MLEGCCNLTSVEDGFIVPISLCPYFFEASTSHVLKVRAWNRSNRVSEYTKTSLHRDQCHCMVPGKENRGSQFGLPR